MFTDQEKRDELTRELKLRERLYPQWVAAGRLRANEAARQLDVLRAIVDDYSNPDSFRLEG